MTQYTTKTDDKGVLRYYKEGTDIVHREDGPAIIDSSGNEFWLINGKLHREDGPAVVFAKGVKWWYKNGMIHRDNGPAKEFVNGNQEWYLEGQKLSEEEYQAKVAI